jgi:regulator of sirC expression with transglutaminase-like and TPR domain
MNTNELSALITLLDDPDEVIYSQVKGKFLSFGEDVIPHLEAAWEESYDEVLQKRIESIIHTIQFEAISNALKAWARDEQEDLLKGVLIVSRYQFAELDEEKIRRQIAQVKQDVWLELNDELTALEKIKIINHILFDVHQFKGNTENYHAPYNSYLNAVLESKQGNPISMCILYMIICKELDIPVFGVDLPLHFILAYIDDAPSFMNFSDNGEPDNILFYINPFSNGIIFSKSDIDQFLSQQNIEPTPRYYKPCTNVDIIKRVLRNLIYSFEKQENTDKVDELKALLQELNIFL